MRLIRVKKHSPCPVCNKTDWCCFNENIAICMRVPSDRPANGKYGQYAGYIHLLTDDVKTERPDPLTAVDVKRASDNECHGVYKALFKMHELALTTDDYRQLGKWGISVEMAKRHGYHRLPLRGRARMAKKLIDKGYNLKGVPGFYIHNDGYWTFSTGPGLIFPSISPQRQIQGFQVRLDKQKRGSKYVWFSSQDRSGGSSSGAPWHLAIPKKLTHKCIGITEGVRKANVAADYLGIYVIGIAGVNNYSGVPELIEKLKMPWVSLFDMDLLSNWHVYKAWVGLMQALKGAGFVGTWDSDFKGLDTKGIDDLLVAGGSPRRLPVDEAMRNIKEPSPIVSGHHQKVLNATQRG